jgi:pimeloyl-ACP methyl ester carboxylesterase
MKSGKGWRCTGPRATLLALALAAGPALASDECAARLGCESSSRHIDGQHAGGERWAIDVPAKWNGTLLLYARGYGSGAPEQAPETAPRGMKEWLLSRGYALAASSYTGVGWALEEAPRDQIEVLDAFTREYGKPRRSIAWGNSMGGLVSVALAERYPRRFDGALPMCGSVSGAVGMLNTALDGAFAFRTLLAPDSDLRVVDIDDDRVNSDRAKRVLDAAWQTPQGRARVLLAAALAQLPSWTDGSSAEPAANDFDAQAEQIHKAFLMGVFVPRTDQERRAKGLYSWNTGVDYRRQLEHSGLLPLVLDAYARAGLALGPDLAALDAAPRIRAQPGAVAYLRANYVPSGKLFIPLLTLQTTGDGVTVPGTHGGYVRIVREAGRSNRLGQLWIRGAGHCTFTPAEIAIALRALEQRLDTGRWALDAASLTKLATNAPGERRFTNYHAPELLRACGPKPGSCAGEPQR